MDYQDIIKNVQYADKVSVLCEALKSCLELLESQYTKKREFIRDLNQQLLYMGGYHKITSILGDDSGLLKNVYIHDYNKAHLVYASHFLIRNSKIIEYRRRLKQLIGFFDSEFEPPKTTGLDKVRINDVLNMLQDRFKVFDIITCKNELEIFLFNNSHKEYNSICEVLYDANDPQTYVKRYILVFASRSKKHDPYQVLVHEIGHALQVALTHRSMLIPESFIMMSRELGVDLKNNNISSADIFADIFSVVAMNKTGFMENNILISQVPPKTMELFENYFDTLIGRSLENLDEVKKSGYDINWELKF